MMYTLIKNVVMRNRHFVIAKNEDGYYLAIEDKYITDGKTNQVLNGIQMHANKTLNGCLQSIQDEVEIEYLMKTTGMELMDAMKVYFKIA